MIPAVVRLFNRAGRFSALHRTSVSEEFPGVIDRGRSRGAADDGDAAAGLIHVHQGRLVRKTGTTVSGCVKAAPSDVSVTIREVSAANWKADVYDRVPADTDSLC